jgi:serine/threonine protein kinase
VERFRREARAAAMIRHPNVVSIYDFNDAEEAYIVMELVEGVSLRGILRREGKLSPERSVKLMNAICAGVGVAHRQGLIHRDLKPDNVIVSPSANDGEPETAKVVDFGLAKIRDGNISPLTITGTLVGTAYYMSPEQCRGEELDARSDVYSLAAMFYEMITGGPPFTGPSVVSLITKHLSEAPRQFADSLRVPAALNEVCMRGLAKNREQRQADAISFGRELQDALAGNYEAKTSTSSGSHVWKWLLIAAAVGVLGVMLVIAAVAIKFGLDRSSIAKSPTQTEEKTNATVTQVDLRGKWVGNYGPVGSAATLVINNQSGNQFDGVLEQGAHRVAFKGSIETETIQMKQTKVLSGDDWSLGEDTGKLSNDGKQMSGSGKDALGGSLGIAYQWSFSRTIEPSE